MSKILLTAFEIHIVRPKLFSVKGTSHKYKKGFHMSNPYSVSEVDPSVENENRADSFQ